MPKLTGKQERFVQEYLIDLNATQAYLRAGYKVKETSARVQACRLLANPNIASAIEAARTKRAERLDASADAVLREIARLAMFDPKDLTDVKSPEDIKNLPEDVRRAIVGWSWDKNGNFTLKMVKDGALQMMARHHGLFNDKIEHSGELTLNGLAERMRKQAAE